MKYVAYINNGFAYDASVKPRQDVATILSKHGWEKLPIRMFGELAEQDLDICLYLLHQGDTVLFQSPLYSSPNAERKYLDVFKVKGVKTIGLLHDVDVIRFGGDLQSYRKLINQYDGLIIASQALADVVKPSVPYVIQKPWDYLTNANPLPHTLDKTIVYAGNLTEGKTAFLDSVDVDTYGELYERKLKHYRGKFKAEDLPAHLDGSFGLVWDSNGYNDYLKYNWSYKFSLYLASGLPVIAKKGSNVGNFVDKYELGFTIASLSELKKPEQYAKYLKNVSEFTTKVRSGAFILEAVNGIENRIMSTTDQAVQVGVRSVID